jgi:uncharacterized SAM-binding protein YcdF (DUF218 family)
MRISRPFLFIAATLIVIVAAVVGLAMKYAASFLRVNRPEHADVILILGGGVDDSRYWRAVELMKAGYADKIVLDAEERIAKYGKSNPQLAREFLDRVDAQNTTVCPAYGDSTYAETEDAARCLAPMKVSSVLIVTSDYHTRRAFSIFKARLPRYRWSVAGAFVPYEHGTEQRLPADNWWRNRRWAKTVLDEWERLVWWELVDRWRPHLVVQS